MSDAMESHDGSTTNNDLFPSSSTLNKTPKNNSQHLSKRKQTPHFMPRRAMTAYNYFVQAKFQECKETNVEKLAGSKKNAAPIALVGELWKALNEKERFIYEKLAQQDQDRYQNEMTAFNNNNKANNDEQQNEPKVYYSFRKSTISPSPLTNSNNSITPQSSDAAVDMVKSSRKVSSPRKRAHSHVNNRGKGTAAGRKIFKRNNNIKTPRAVQSATTNNSNLSHPFATAGINIQHHASLSYSTQEKEQLLKDAQNDAKKEFEMEKQRILALIPSSLQDLFGQIGFVKWNTTGASGSSSSTRQLLPVLVLNPYNVPPEPVRTMFLNSLTKAQETGRLDKIPLIIYWYGATREKSMYSLIPQTSFISYEQGMMAHGACIVPASIQQKLDNYSSNGSAGATIMLSKAEQAKVRARDEVEQDLIKQPSERRRGIVHFVEGYQTLNLQEVEETLNDYSTTALHGVGDGHGKEKVAPRKRSIVSKRRAGTVISRSSTKKAVQTRRRVSKVNVDDAPTDGSTVPTTRSSTTITTSIVPDAGPKHCTPITPFLKTALDGGNVNDQDDDHDNKDEKSVALVPSPHALQTNDGDDTEKNETPTAANDASTEKPTLPVVLPSPEYQTTATHQHDETEADIDEDTTGAQFYDDDFEDEIEVSSVIHDPDRSPSLFDMKNTIMFKLFALVATAVLVAGAVMATTWSSALPIIYQHLIGRTPTLQEDALCFTDISSFVPLSSHVPLR